MYLLAITATGRETRSYWHIISFVSIYILVFGIVFSMVDFLSSDDSLFVSMKDNSLKQQSKKPPPVAPKPPKGSYHSVLEQPAMSNSTEKKLLMPRLVLPPLQQSGKKLQPHPYLKTIRRVPCEETADDHGVTHNLEHPTKNRPKPSRTSKQCKHGRRENYSSPPPPLSPQKASRKNVTPFTSHDKNTTEQSLNTTQIPFADEYYHSLPLKKDVPQLELSEGIIISQ